MEAVPVLAAAGVAAASLLLATATRRSSLTTGVLTALLLLVLAGGPLPTPESWTAAMVAYIVATLLGGWLLLAGMRRTGILARPSVAASGLWGLGVVAASFVGVVLWPEVIALLDPARAVEARAAGWLEPSRWAAGGGLALALGALRLLAANEPPRLAAGAAALSGAAWLLATSAGAHVADVALPAMGLVLPVAAAAALADAAGTVGAANAAPASDADPIQA